MRHPRAFLLPALCAALTAACGEHGTEPLAPAPSTGPTAALLQTLEHAGYAGPVLIQQATAHDFRGVHPFSATISLPERGREMLASASAENRWAVRAATASLADADAVDPANNSPRDSLGGYVLPSAFTSVYRLTSSIDLTNTFWDYDWNTNTWHQIMSGTVLSSKIVPHENSGGHHHGSLDSQLKTRAGRLSPTTGSLSSGVFQDTWWAPEFAQEVRFDYTLEYTDYQGIKRTEVFESEQPFATRTVGLQPIPAGTDYDLVGATVAHPYNHWASSELLSEIQRGVAAYHRRTGQRVQVNDASMMYGGRFDAGLQKSATVWIPCDNAHLSVCWGNAHGEHRYGTEVDLKTYDWSNAVDRSRLLAALQLSFAQIYQEGSHYHGRSSDSPFVRRNP